MKSKLSYEDRLAALRLIDVRLWAYSRIYSVKEFRCDRLMDEIDALLDFRSAFAGREAIA